MQKWQLLKQAILLIAKNNEVIETIITLYGIKFILVGSLNMLNKENYSIKTIWMNSGNNKDAVFVTAYPI